MRSFSDEATSASARKYRSYAVRSLAGRLAERRISAACNVGSMTPATLDATFSCKSNISSNECMLRSITPAFGRTEPGRHGCSLTDADDLADYLFQSRWAKGSGCSTRGGVRAWPIG